MYLYSPHYIFYPCGGSICVCHIRVVRPKSDRLSARKKKRLASFLSKDYELKSQVLCEFEKKLQKIFQSRRKPASLIANLSSKKGGNLMKEQIKKSVKYTPSVVRALNIYPRTNAKRFFPHYLCVLSSITMITKRKLM